MNNCIPHRLFHISENGSIDQFIPQPSPSHFDAITGNVVFGITEKLLHNYLFPRDCPRVTYYATDKTSQADKKQFLAHSTAQFVLAVEAKWLEKILTTTLYCYEFETTGFSLLDECAGYYISYKTVVPIAKRPIENPLQQLLANPTIECRFLPSLWPLANAIKKSSLNFSLIRMRNASE